MKLISIKKEDLGCFLHSGNNYQIIEFCLKHEYLEVAILEVICSEKIDEVDLEGYFALIDYNDQVIFLGRSKFPIDHSRNFYLFEAIPPDLDDQIEEIKKKYLSFENKLLNDCPIYITSKDLKVYSIVDEPKLSDKIISKENIYIATPLKKINYRIFNLI